MTITEAGVREVFAHLENRRRADFLERVADDVDWTVRGQHPLAGRFTTKAAFVTATLDRLHKVMAEPLTMRVTNVVVAGDRAAVEMHGRGVGHGGDIYENDFCWMTWWRDGRIVKVHAYLDSVAVQRFIDAAEGPA